VHFPKFSKAEDHDPLSLAGKKRPRSRTPIACEPCIKLKAGCGTKRPCDRCVKRNVTHLCVDRKRGRLVSKSKDGSEDPPEQHHDGMLQQSAVC
jgi:hypothetical protein